MSIATKIKTWDPIAYRDKIQPDIDKTLTLLKSKGVEVTLEDENPNLNNLTFSDGKNSIKMSHHSFYRYAGRGLKKVPVGKQEKGGKNDFKFVRLPIGEYMQNLIVPIILHLLKTKI